jgi:hypothetical protein
MSALHIAAYYGEEGKFGPKLGRFISKKVL